VMVVMYERYHNSSEHGAVNASCVSDHKKV